MFKRFSLALPPPTVSSIAQFPQSSKRPSFPQVQPNIPKQKETLEKSSFIVLTIISFVEYISINMIDKYLEPHESQVSLLYYLIFVLFMLVGFVLSWLGNYTISQKKPRTKKTILLLASLSLSLTFFFDRLLFASRAFKASAEPAWCFFSLSMISVVSHFLLSDFVFNVWYFKILPFLGDIAAVIVAYCLTQHRHFTFEWLIILVSLVSIIFIFFIKEKTRRKSDNKNQEAKEWSNRYESMLEMLSNAILLIDQDDKLVYNNTEYEKLSNKYEGNLLNKISSIQIVNHEEQETLSAPKLSNKHDGVESIYTFSKQLCDDTDRDHINESPNSVKFGNLSEAIQAYRRLDRQCVLTFQSNAPITLRGVLPHPDSSQPCLQVDIRLNKLVYQNEIMLVFNETSPRDMLIPLQNANEYKDHLLSTVSHEMRTPLNGNIAFLESALNNRNVPLLVKEDLLLPAYRSAQLLLHLVNDLLDMAQIQTQKLRLAYESLSIKSTIENCCKLVELKAMSRNVNLSMDFSANIPEYFCTDHNRLGQIILNLLSNSLKFTFEGQVNISARQIKPSLIEIVISDTGIGMNAEDIKKLFQRFTHIGYGRRKNVNKSGVGLGLSISNSLAKMLGPAYSKGITVKSIPEQGSTFSFVIEEADLGEERFAKTKQNKDKGLFRKIIERNRPDDLTSPKTQDEFMSEKSQFEGLLDSIRKPYESPNMKKLEELKRTWSYDKSLNSSVDDKLLSSINKSTSGWKVGSIVDNEAKVLVVDDEPFNILAIRSLMNTLELKMTSAYNGKEAVEKFLKKMRKEGQEMYKLIIMDCQMPEMDGYETAKMLKQIMKENNMEDIPIIGCSGFQTKEHFDLCSQSGMKEVILKPISKEKLEEIVKKYLNKEAGRSL